jgi:uncharacterized damage-inducible protein DinB
MTTQRTIDGLRKMVKDYGKEYQGGFFYNLLLEEEAKQAKASMEKKLMDLDQALEDIERELDAVTNPWESQKLEGIFTKLWKEYHMIRKQIEAEECLPF